MVRTPLRFLALMVLAVSVGCLGVSPPNDQTDAATTVTPKPTPDSPRELTCESVEAYVEGYERVVRYNALVDEYFSHAALGCNATVVDRTEFGYYLRAGCGGAAYYDTDGDGTASSVSDMGMLPVDYLVTNGSTRRVRADEVVGGTPFESDTSTGDSLERFGSLSVLNFGDRPERVDVTVRYIEGGENETALDETYTIDPISGRTVYRVSEQPGTYVVTVTVDNQSYRHEWLLSDQSQNAFSVVVWPDGDVTVGPRPVVEY